MDNGGIKSGLAQGATTLSEAVAKPVVDEVGKAIEVGVQSVTGSTPKPQDPLTQQKKQEAEQKKKAWALSVIDWYKKIQEKQAQVRQNNLQQDQAKRTQEEEDKEKAQIKQYEVVKKQEQVLPPGVAQAQGKVEKKGGVGG